MKFRKIPTLLIASTAAVIGLVAFQMKWIDHSRQLAEETFNQRACMALCSTVENFGGGAHCSQSGCAATCEAGDPNGSLAVPANLASDPAFNEGLRKSLDFYHVDLPYQLTLATSQEVTQSSDEAYQCAVALPAGDSLAAAYLQLQFPDKNPFLLGKMRFMVVATVLIILFTTLVLCFANWSLAKQKRLLETNVDFFNNMAHEFRTPLTNIGLATKLLSKKTRDLKEESFVEIIRRENARLLAQVERVLHLARLENGDYVLQKEPMHLKTILSSVRDDMAMQIDQRHAVVNLDAVPPDVEICGDKLHLSNVFRNLLDNALKYSNAAPLIQISAREHPKGILVQVQDNGTGIPPEHCELIFEKFQRVGQGDLHELKGFGLGLAYVKRMVEMHGGFVRVQSELNRGSSFEVCLPKNKMAVR